MVKITSNMNNLEKVSIKMTNWIGTPVSLVIHTVAFIGIFSLKFLGFHIEDILLILTTAVSLEAIYLAIFIQMTVNRNTESIEDLQEDVEDIQEDVEELEEGIGKSSAGDKLQKFLGLKH